MTAAGAAAAAGAAGDEDGEIVLQALFGGGGAGDGGVGGLALLAALLQAGAGATGGAEAGLPNAVFYQLRHDESKQSDINSMNAMLNQMQTYLLYGDYQGVLRLAEGANMLVARRNISILTRLQYYETLAYVSLHPEGVDQQLDKYMSYGSDRDYTMLLIVALRKMKGELQPAKDYLQLYMELKLEPLSIAYPLQAQLLWEMAHPPTSVKNVKNCDDDMTDEKDSGASSSGGASSSAASSSQLLSAMGEQTDHASNNTVLTQCLALCEKALHMSETCEEAYMCIADIWSKSQHLFDVRPWIRRWVAACPKSPAAQAYKYFVAHMYRSTLQGNAAASLTLTSSQNPEDPQIRNVATTPDQHTTNQDVEMKHASSESIEPLVELTTSEQVEKAIVYMASQVMKQVDESTAIYKLVCDTIQQYGTLLGTMNSGSGDHKPNEPKRTPICTICMTDPPEYINKTCCHMCYCEDCVMRIDPLIKLRTRFPQLAQLLPQQIVSKCPVCRAEGQVAKVWV
jgi:hypothetical protein